MSEKLVQLLIVSDSKLQVTRDDTGLLVVTSGVASKFEDFSSEVLEDGETSLGGSTVEERKLVDINVDC